MSRISLPESKWEAGVCHFVATPIGNLADIGLRALAVLAEADIIFAEDTRKTGRLLSRYEIKVPLASYHDHNKDRAVRSILERLQGGQKVAVVSDAGMPCICDPGYALIKALLAAGYNWRVIPGPSSLLAALVLSGMPPDRFLFLGYLPRKKGPRQKTLVAALAAEVTIVAFESCHRIASTLAMLADLGPDRELAIVREITKLHEETLRGTPARLQVLMTDSRLKGELVLVLAGKDGSANPDHSARCAPSARAVT